MACVPASVAAAVAVAVAVSVVVGVVVELLSCVLVSGETVVAGRVVEGSDALTSDE